MLQTVLKSNSRVLWRRHLNQFLWRPYCATNSNVSSLSPLEQRYFSVATTTHETVVEDISENTIEFPTKKKKKRDKPTRKKARRLFDELAPHLPLKTLNAIVRNLKRSKVDETTTTTTTTTRIGQVHALLKNANMDPWASTLFEEFFLLQPFSSGEEKEDFPANVNKQSLESFTEILMKARDLSAETPLLWSVNQRKKIQAERASKNDKDDGASSSTPDGSETTPLAVHQAKSKKQRQREAKELATLLAERLPEKAFHDLMQVFASYVDETTNRKKPKMRRLFTNLSKTTSTHIHFVAEEVASFLYVQHSATSSDPRVVRRLREWKQRQDDFCNDVLTMYDALDNPILMANNRFLRGQNSDTLQQLEKLRTRPSDGVKVGRDRNKEQAQHGRRKKNVHLVFDAMQLQDEWNAASTLQQQHVVFVDNLPIDMQETDLFDLFSRCGPVQSVQVFNQREELDPGPLTAKKRRAQKVRQRMSSNRRRWKRPRTPVYGQVTFASQQGYDNALVPELRIFGMVVQKHPMRTIRPMDMTSLYLEDIPGGMYSLDIEHKLSQLLHPEIYVSLNIGQHDFAEPSSCEIKFPSFEMANHAYQRLQELDMEGSSIQWMRTPGDANKYWTREFSFET